MSVSTFLHLRLSHLLSLSFAAPISVSDHFLETLPWGSRSPVCRKPDLHHLFFIFWKRPLNFLPEGSGGGGSGLPGSTSFHPPSFTESILAPPHTPVPYPQSSELRPSLLRVTMAPGIRLRFTIFPPQLTAGWGRQRVLWSTAGLLIWEKVKIPGTERAQEAERFHQWKAR